MTLCQSSACTFFELNTLLPRFILVTLFVLYSTSAVSGATIWVGSGGDLQSAINAAQPGDTIILEAGATYIGPFVLPLKPGEQFITIQSSRLNELPPGQRVSPAQAALMPKLVSLGLGERAILTAAGAHHYQLLGIEVAPANENALIYDLISLGSGGQSQLTLESVPHHLIIDRCYIHALPNQSLKRGIALNSAYTDIVNSYVAGFKVVGQDSQAIAGWNGPGPYRIINNYLEAAGENVMFGGADPSIPGLIPGDIVIKQNHFFKPLTWKVGDPSYAGTRWTVKNLFETKNARRVMVDGNIFENSWLDAQVGFGILLKSNNQDGTAPWSVTEDLIFSNNIVKGVEHGLNILGVESPPKVSGVASRFRIINNFWDVQKIWYQGTNGAVDVVLDHNTFLSREGNTATLYGLVTQGFVFKNNLGVKAGYGFKGDSVEEGTATLNAFCPGWIFEKNVLIGASSEMYPTNNFYPKSLSDVGFMDLNGKDYRLGASSEYRNAATDGKDVGCDFESLFAALGNNLPTALPGAGLFSAVWRAKRTGQILSNALVSNSFKTTQTIAVLISEIDLAYTEFNRLRALYPRAAEIDLQLTYAKSCALTAGRAESSGDFSTLQNELRKSIDHLALGGILIEHPEIRNPIDESSYMVRQNYLDFLNREPDAAGGDFWTGNITVCGTNASCVQVKRVNVSAAFFLSIEFKETGYYVYRLYKSSYGRFPTIAEFMPDTVEISRGVIVGTEGWTERLTANKQQFVSAWVQRPAFQSQYGGLTNAQYVDSLIGKLGVTVSSEERNALVQSLANGTTRATVLEQLATNPAFSQKEINPAFVLMEYFGYLRRDPDAAGFNFWLNKLEAAGGNYERAEMVRAFLESIEYRERFRF